MTQIRDLPAFRKRAMTPGTRDHDVRFRPLVSPPVIRPTDPIHGLLKGSCRTLRRHLIRPSDEIQSFHEKRVRRAIVKGDPREPCEAGA